MTPGSSRRTGGWTRPLPTRASASCRTCSTCARRWPSSTSPCQPAAVRSSLPTLSRYPSRELAFSPLGGVPAGACGARPSMAQRQGVQRWAGKGWGAGVSDYMYAPLPGPVVRCGVCLYCRLPLLPLFCYYHRRRTLPIGILLFEPICRFIFIFVPI
eukprot:scaffold3196_cov92-Isochrysis_galbana.AAC.3